MGKPARSENLPIPLSGGVFQVIYAMTAGRFGIAEAPAVAVALLIQTIQVIPTVVIGTSVVPMSATRGGG